MFAGVRKFYQLKNLSLSTSSSAQIHRDICFQICFPTKTISICYRKKNLVEAKAELEKEFSKTHLWKYTKEKGFEDLGTPSKFNSRFSASIKDCMEGAKTTLGNDCSRFEGTSRRGCCGEKFTGPEVSWGSKGEYTLLYSPDPSTRLKVDGEKKHRYCNVQETIKLQ